MNKKFSYILISLCMLGLLLAPFTPVLQTHTGNISLRIPLNEAVAQTPATPAPATGTLYDKIGDCGVFGDASVTGCFVVLTYYLFVSVPSWLMGLTAQLFNFMAGLTISSDMYQAPFIQKIWQIIRDFANIFFILILLYAAFQIILGLGHGGGKSTVAAVILVALLVNFSLFVSKVVIDSSNVLALIFYNKITCQDKQGGDCIYDEIGQASETGITEKNIAGALVSKFDINKFYTGEFLKKQPSVANQSSSAVGFLAIFISPGAAAGIAAANGAGTHLEDGTAITLIITYGLIAWSLAWIFLVVGISFLSRMITLMLLMIVSPIAFVTATVPKFRNINTIGFSSWISQLIETSFVAAIFMMILYLVSEVMNAQLFDTSSAGTKNPVADLLLLVIPALIILIFLWKGSKYAKEASGAFTEVIMSGAKAVGGLALGGIALGAGVAAFAGRQTVGSVAKYVQNDTARSKDSLKDFSNWSLKKKFNPMAYGRGVSALAAQGIHGIKTGKDNAGNQTTLGTRMQNSDKGLTQKVSAINTLNQKAKSEFGHMPGYEDVKFKQLTDTEKTQVKTAVEKDEMAKHLYGGTLDKLTLPNKQDIENRYIAGERAIADATGKTARVADMASVNTVSGEKLRTDVLETYSKQNKAVGEFVQALRKGSYDIRNISQADPITKTIVGTTLAGAAGLFAGTGLLGSAALGATGSTTSSIRSALSKGSPSYGNGEKDFLKDLKGILGGALSNLSSGINEMSAAAKTGVKVDLNVLKGGGSSGGGGHH